MRPVPFLMINEDAWLALAPSDQERVRAAESVRLGEMPLWIDERDGSRWLVAADTRTQFGANVALLQQLDAARGGRESALVFQERPDWAQAVTDDELVKTEVALDVGVALLRPVSQREVVAIEELLGLLWRLIESNELAPGQAAQIQAMAQFLGEASREFEPEDTERWKVVGVVRGALRPVIMVAQAVGAAAKIVDLVRKVGWADLAGELVELIS